MCETVVKMWPDNDCSAVPLPSLSRVINSLLSYLRRPSDTVPDFPIARSRFRLPPVAAVYQRQLSVPSLRGRLMSTSESWGVNGHTTRCTTPYPWSCSFGWCPAEGYRKRRSAPPYGPLRLRKGLYYFTNCAVQKCPCRMLR